tara:strand:+ start:107 stop:226 length:120 start_codon:yes stop_codon:yes gene_type:complete
VVEQVVEVQVVQVLKMVPQVVQVEVKQEVMVQEVIKVQV